MNCRIVRAGALPTIRLIAAVGTLGLFASSAGAQTLTDPNPPAKWSPPTVKPDAKAKPAARVKSCSAYGAGFINVPGTDTCVKVGGWVTVEGTAGR